MGMRIPSGSAAASAAGGSGTAAWQQRQQSFKDLTQALQSNQLAAAKPAYAALTGSQPGAAPAHANSPLAQVGQALQKNDLGGAQKALAMLRARPRHEGASRPPVVVSSDPVAPSTSGRLNLVA